MLWQVGRVAAKEQRMVQDQRDKGHDRKPQDPALCFFEAQAGESSTIPPQHAYVETFYILQKRYASLEDSNKHFRSMISKIRQDDVILDVSSRGCIQLLPLLISKKKFQTN